MLTKKIKPPHFSSSVLSLLILSGLFFYFGAYGKLGYSASAKTQTLIQPQTQQVAATAVKPSLFISKAQPAAAKKVLSSQMSIQIPVISLNAPVITTGLESNGELHVPSNPFQVGWYKYSPTPGGIGPSVLTGHMNFGVNFQPTVFYNLHKLQIGDEINVTRSDGSVAIFLVTNMAYYSQNNFPTQLVYGGIKDAELRLITCAGTYDKSTGRYTQDLVVFAKLSAITNTKNLNPL